MVALVLLRFLIAVFGAVALYWSMYWLAGWVAHGAGYDTPVGQGAAFISGALSPLAFGVVVVPLLAVLLFWLLPKIAPTIWSKGSH